MTSDNPPKQPNKRSERREQADRIAEISHRITDIGHAISVAVRGLGDQIFALTNQIQADSGATDTREKEHDTRSLFWVKWGTIFSIALSVFSLLTAVGALYVVYKQLSTMRIEQRAWITIEHKAAPIAENKPLITEIIIRNIGKTPAKQVVTTFQVEKVKRDHPPDLGLIERKSVTTLIGIVNPNVIVPGNIPLLGEKSELLNPPVLRKGDVAEIKSGEAYIVAFGKVTYLDVYDTLHWIDFCSYQAKTPGTYNFGNCVQYNNVDNN